jgi:hypothetical protein
MELKLFSNLTKSQFATDARYFADPARAKLKERFYNWAVNCVARVIEFGDIKWANKASAAAELIGFGPTFRRCFVPNIPFPYDREAHIFTGSIQPGKRNALATMNAEGILNFEADIRRRLDEESKPKAAKEKTAEDYIKAIERACLNALKHGVSAPEAKKALSEACAKMKLTAVDKAA